MTKAREELEQRINLLLANVKLTEKVSALEKKDLATQEAYRLAQLWGQRNYPCLIQYAQEVLERDVHNFFAHYYRGLAFRRRQKYDEAIQDFTAAIDLRPYGDFYLQRGIAWAHKQEWVKAIQDYQTVQQLAPHYADAYLWEGRAWQEMGNLEKAIQNYDQALHYKPGYWVAYRDRGVAWQKKGNKKQAQEDLAKARKLKPKEK